MTRSIFGWFCVAVLFGAASGRADIIVQYDLDGEPGDQEFSAPATENAGISGLNMARGPGISPSSAGDSFSSNGWDDIASDEFMSFGFSVDPLSLASLENLQITTRSSNTGPGNLGLFHSGDGFTTSLHTFTQSGSDFLDSTVDLSSLSNLTGTQEFRIYALNDTSANGGTISAAGTFRIANFDEGGGAGGVTFNGTVSAVPEPSSFSVFGLAVLGGLTLRRRRDR